MSPAKPSPSRATFLVVGLGASAGGLEALMEFFSAVPADIGTAFVVITHQTRGTVSLLPQLLSKVTKLPVVAITDGLRLEPRTVYVAPSNDLSLGSGCFRLLEPPAAVPHHPIDAFFRSLAREYGERAIAIVLSGTGSDGTLGLTEIKSAGGMVFAQSSGTARYASMPASAEGTRLVDDSLPPKEMPARLVALERRSVAKPQLEAGDTTAALYRVLHLLRTRTGSDFTAYKKSTLWRRIERRMTVTASESAAAYERLLHEAPEEVERLFRELLIGVTSFFRDPQAFETVGSELGKLLASWGEARPFRIWVPACSTGEEAYSLAIIVREVLDELAREVPVQIFATDLDGNAVNKARAGRYPEAVAASVGQARLRRFFVKEDGAYRVSKAIRESIVFAVQSVTKDPPFTRLDLLSCRNLLIYLEPTLQRKVIGLFAYALTPGGLLLLGTSESISGFNEAFENVDKKSKLFRRRHTRAETPPEFSTTSSKAKPERVLDLPAQADASTVKVIQGVEQALLSNLAPPSVLITKDGDVLYFHGRTGRFLEPPAGEPVSNLFNMLRNGLQREVPAAVRQAKLRGEPAVRVGLQVVGEEDSFSVRLTVRRLTEPAAVRGLFLVTFEAEPALKAKGKPAVRPDASPSKRLTVLELELQHTRENLHGTIEELETSNEELKSTNEELQSTNEELQSVNEELETSREEMQSLNEELQTVNSELEERNRALSQANDDMQNLLNSTEVATIFLDHDLAIRRFTTQARRIFSLIDTDVGRPLSDLAANLEYDGFVNDARAVLETLVFQEREIRTKDGGWRLMRIMPYRTAENVIDGLVMTFIDIHRVKEKELESEAAGQLARAMLESIPAGVLLLDPELRVISANLAFLELFRTSLKQTLGEPVQALADGALDSAEFLDSLSAVASGAAKAPEFRLRAQGRKLAKQQLALSARKVSSPTQQPLLLLMVRAVNGAPAQPVA